MRVLRRIGFIAVLCFAELTWGQSAPPAATSPTTPPRASSAPVTTAVEVPPDPNAPSDPPSVTGDTPTKPIDATKLESKAPAFSTPATSFAQVIERMSAREQEFLKNLRQYTPLVETYVQNMKPDADLGAVPASDSYFLGRLELTAAGTADHSFLAQKGRFAAALDHLTSLFSLHYVPLGFAQMILPDNGGLNAQNYDFKYVRHEFLGELRCVVIDVTPKKSAGKGRFLGRIWVEDQGYNIVRFNGTYAPAPRMSSYLHFDSWRLNMKPGVWLPAYIYSEESDLHGGLTNRAVRFKAQTRLWQYNKHDAHDASEFTTITVDDQQVQDQSQAAQDLSPVESQRAWEHQAEDNVLDRLTRAGLLAEPGEVDKVLETVVNNLVVTNKLDIEPAVRCRVLLTTPMESFSVGHTIVVSRGLIDVLPDEASLAAVLAHELAHISLGHRLDTKYAFVDRSLFPDEATYRKMQFHHSSADEAAADAQAVNFMRNSPYKDKLDSVSLFLKALEQHAPELPNLIAAHLGDSFAYKNGVRMAQFASSGPSLDVKRVDQIAALPLGGRLHVDPFSDRVELNKNKPVALLSAREKMSFEVTPVFPHLRRVGDAATTTAIAKTN